ncbi:MAG TPA: glycosyltransferase family 4 protein [Thermoanaerobaculia bacterium]|nr:glycosyltransferase family 4 protein [Thermoanaerobaculia bacterium]
MTTAVFSIVSPNYRSYARVLMGTAKDIHPEWDRYVLLVGDTSATPLEEPLFTTVSTDALPLPNRKQFCFRYTLLELNTAVKPWMFEHLFARGYDRVIYLDPDIHLYSRLTELDASPPDTFLTLTPHLTGSIEGDGHPSERAILQAGTYNLGFLAVSRQPALQTFLDWWKAKLEFQCVVEVERGLFVDQKWIDLAPGLFPGVQILRHDGYNVAYWNLRQRSVVQHEVNGQPLRFFHFSGADPATPRLLSRHDVLTIDDIGDAAKLLEHYLAALRAAGHESSKKSRYAYGVFADGSPLPDFVRINYRQSSALQTSCGPDPFAHPEVFRDLRERKRSNFAAKIAWHTYNVLSRVRPIVQLIPKGLRTTAREFLLGRHDPVTLRGGTSLPPGLNVVGYTTRATGVGESARLCQKSCEAVALPSDLIDVDATDPLAQEAIHRASVYHVNADMTLHVHHQLPHLFSASAYNIGVWHWELPELPDEWIASAGPLNEIWAPSAFIQSAVSKKVTIPVLHMPHGIEVKDIESCTPEELGVPAGRFTFLSMFDLTSKTRKNPLGAVVAFRRINTPASLLIKTSHAKEFPDRYAALEEQLRGIPNVYVTKRMLSRAQTNGLIAACDAFVSLHHAEGFGLIPAEAMYFGKPVVATGWSGNMDFMDATNSCPIAYELVTLEQTHGPYRAGEQWADPDLDHAAQQMRRLVDDAAFRAQISERAKATMRAQFSPRAAGLRYRARLKFLGLIA